MSDSNGTTTRRRPQPGNLQLRIISGIILAAAALGATWLGGTAFRLLCLLIAAAMFFEWCAITRPRAEARHQVITACLLAVVLIVMLSGWADPPAAFAGAFVLSAAAGLLLGRWRWTLAGLAYAGMSGLALAALRGGDDRGLFTVLFLFAVVWATDILAYFVGRAVGGPKLAPGISPGKTWSGAAGGLVSGVMAGVLVAAMIGAANILLLALIAAVLSSASQAGDLFESWVKRRHGVKDSGRLIPGHGGMMDRVDGLVAGAVALYGIVFALGGGNALGWTAAP